MAKSAKQKAQIRNFGKFRLAGMKSQLTSMIQSKDIGLTDREKSLLKNAQSKITKVITEWK